MLLLSLLVTALTSLEQIHEGTGLHSDIREMKVFARLQVPHDQPKVAQAMIEKWIDGVLKNNEL